MTGPLSVLMCYHEIFGSVPKMVQNRTNRTSSSFHPSCGEKKIPVTVQYKLLFSACNSQKTLKSRCFNFHTKNQTHWTCILFLDLNLHRANNYRSATQIFSFTWNQTRILKTLGFRVEIIQRRRRAVDWIRAPIRPPLLPPPPPTDRRTGFASSDASSLPQPSCFLSLSLEISLFSLTLALAFSFKLLHSTSLFRKVLWYWEEILFYRVNSVSAVT